MVNKIRPEAKIIDVDDGYSRWREVRYYCPTCGRTIGKYRKETACDECGTFYDWSEQAEIETIYQIKWRK